MDVVPYKEYTVADLSGFTGRPAASFPTPYVTASAFPQALLLFKLGTCLYSPDDLTEEQKLIADFAIMSMADAIHLSAPYQTVLASPFSSESIGSYSYSKVAMAVQAGLPTGVGWFDIAISQLSVCDDIDSVPSFGGIEVFEHQGVFTNGYGGNRRFLTPGDLVLMRGYGYDPAPWFDPSDNAGAELVGFGEGPYGSGAFGD